MKTNLFWARVMVLFWLLEGLGVEAVIIVEAVEMGGRALRFGRNHPKILHFLRPLELETR